MNEIEKTIILLKKQFPSPGAMEIGNPYQTLVAVILSARVRDEQVLRLLPQLFTRYPTVHALAKSKQKDVERMICSIGMFRMKAKNLCAMAKCVVTEFHGRVPCTMEELVSLAGVGRKTASVVLVACFGKSAIAVDTHVHRVTNRMGFVKTKTPQKTELALLDIVSRKRQSTVNRVMVKFGRYICLPVKPRCWMCPVRKHCLYNLKNLRVPKNADEIRKDVVRREHELETLRINAV